MNAKMRCERKVCYGASPVHTNYFLWCVILDPARVILRTTSVRALLCHQVPSAAHRRPMRRRTGSPSVSYPPR